jgi:hypothetical protein
MLSQRYQFSITKLSLHVVCTNIQKDKNQEQIQYTYITFIISFRVRDGVIEIRINTWKLRALNIFNILAF